MTLADKINEAISNGMTVYVTSYTRVTKINKKMKAVKYWAERGINMFKMGDDGCVMMLDGFKDADTPKWSNASGAKIDAF